jgi:hypothetical protein
MVDYNLKSPLYANGSNFPCRGYQNDRPIRTTATYTAGQTYEMSVTDTVTHGGGSCQLSLSYDNGATFKVIKSIIGGCPLTMSYNFTVPGYAPSGNALFAWTWFNEIGNREMYMNCAQVQIIASPSARRRAQKRSGQYTSMDSLPYIWRANIQGLSTCVTIEGQDPVFSNLGPDVMYQNTMTPSSPVTPGNNCDSPTPYGQTYRSISDNSTTSASAVPTPTFSNIPPANNVTTNPTQPTFNGSSSYLSYTSNSNSSSYLPCVPGTFLCLSSMSYLVCNQATGVNAFTPLEIWDGPFMVADGMVCAPFLTQFLDNTTAAEFVNNTAWPQGWYRSDRYVAAGTS